MSNEQRLVALHHLRRLQARDRLEFRDTIASLFADAHDNWEDWLLPIIETAYGDDDELYAKAVGSYRPRRSTR